MHCMPADMYACASRPTLIRMFADKIRCAMPASLKAATSTARSGWKEGEVLPMEMEASCPSAAGGGAAAAAATAAEGAAKPAL